VTLVTIGGQVIALTASEFEYGYGNHTLFTYRWVMAQWQDKRLIVV